jgi:nigerose phosphorylase
LEAKYKVYVGTIFMGGSHPAANGGAWMAAVFGFGGLRADDKKVTIHPRMYSKWKKLSFNIRYKNDFFAISIEPGKLKISAGEGNARSHIFFISSKEIPCEPGKTIETSY